MEASFERRLMVSVDARGYGRANDQLQSAVQAGLIEVLDRAARQSGLDRSKWHRQAAGDGELALLPSGDAGMELVVVDDFVRTLNNALAEHNRLLGPENRLRLRLAVHFGVASPDSNGFSGQGVVAVSRLVDSSAVRTALDQIPDAELAVIVSQRVFLDTVAQGHTSLRRKDFREVRVQNKEFDESAYLYVPGHDVNEVLLSDAAGEQPAQAPSADESDTPNEPRASRSAGNANVETTIHGNINMPNGVIGISWNQ